MEINEQNHDTPNFRGYYPSEKAAERRFLGRKAEKRVKTWKLWTLSPDSDSEDNDQVINYWGQPTD